MQRRDTKNNWVPEQIGNYKIAEIVGMGGMGIIYKALQQPINRIVALKVLPPQFSQDKESSLRFQTEAKAISMLQHQNIVQLYEYGEENGCLYFTMQFIDGEDLSQKISEKKPMPLEQIIDYTKQICRGLRYAHSMSVIHRDIKPQNVLIDKNSVARLSDFGIAKMVSQNDITMTGVTVGTPEYMSPEQAAGKDLTIGTDIYSLGILVYEMLTKQPPFLANNPIAVAYKQVHEMPAPPSAKRKDTPKRLELIVLKALKKDVRERYQTVDEMLDHLDSVDIHEKIERTTVLVGTKPAPAAESTQFVEKRIVDRRSFSRREAALGGAGHPRFFSPAYWYEVLRYQWPALVLLAALYIIALMHIFKAPSP